MRRMECWARWAVSFGLCVACGGESATGDSTNHASTPGGSAGTSGSAAALNGGSAGAGGSASPARGGSTSTNGSGGTSLGGSAGASAAGGISNAGRAPVDGEGGSAGDPGNPENEPEPVRIIRGDPEDEFWDLTIRGQALDEYEGKLVIVRMGWPDRAPERLVSGGARIEDGAFDLVFPAAWEADLYKTKLVLIDVNGDHACDLTIDRLFGDSRASYADGFVVNLGSPRGMFDMAEIDDAFYCGWFNSEWPSE